jgi:hypothetical protein
VRGCSFGIINRKDLWCIRLRWPQLAWHIDIKFHDDWFRNSSNIKGITSTIWEAALLILLMRGIYDVRHWDDLRWHDIYIPSFLKIGTCAQAILRFRLRNLGGWNVGITDGRDLWITPLRGAQVHSRVVRGDKYTDTQTAWRPHKPTFISSK